MDAEGRSQRLRFRTILRKMSTVIRSKPGSYSCTENATYMFGIDLPSTSCGVSFKQGHCIQGSLGPSCLSGLWVQGWNSNTGQI